MKTRDIRLADLEIRQTMDPESLDVLVQGQLFCMLQWHDNDARVNFPTGGVGFIDVRADVLSHLAFKVREEQQKYIMQKRGT